MLLQDVADSDKKFLVNGMGGNGKQSDGGTSHFFDLLEKNEFYVPPDQQLRATNFYVLLTVHSSISLDSDQLEYTIALFYNTFIIILYMFRSLHAHHQEVELY